MAIAVSPLYTVVCMTVVFRWAKRISPLPTYYVPPLMGTKKTCYRAFFFSPPLRLSHDIYAPFFCVPKQKHVTHLVVACLRLLFFLLFWAAGRSIDDSCVFCLLCSTVVAILGQRRPMVLTSS